MGEPSATDNAIETLLRELDDVRGTMGCGTCECFLGVVAQARADIKALGAGPAPGGGDASLAAAVPRALAVFDEWLEAASGRVTSCRRCEVCVPTGPYRRLRAALGMPPGDPVSMTGDAGSGRQGCHDPDATDPRP